MCDIIVPPSPNWYLSNVIACSDDGKTLAYGARHELVIVKLVQEGKKQASLGLPSFIPVAHKEKVTCVAFPSSSNDFFKNHIASCSDDGGVRVWNYQEQKLKFFHNGHPEGHKVVGLDWSRADVNLVVSVTDLGTIVCWDLASNTFKRLFSGNKICPLTVACNPHNKDAIAIGAKAGLIVIYNVKGDGEVVFKMRAHETDVISLAYCPVPHNIFQSNSKDKVHLLASGSKDKVIYFWKTASDGRYETTLPLPPAPLTGRKSATVSGPGGNNWVCVRWANQETLLCSSLFGELLSYNLPCALNVKASQDGQKKKQLPKPTVVHGCHSKGLFSIAVGVAPEDGEDPIVWTSALDKKLICSSLSSEAKVLHNISTIGGIVYCFAISPIDPNRLAFGTGDNKVNIWNLSSSSNEITFFWNKINSRVMALAWHPSKENELAFGTGEGRVGLLDVGSGRHPILLRLFHRRSVYSLVWAPLVIHDHSNVGRIGLFSVGDGEILQYDTLHPDKEPESLNQLLKASDAATSVSKTLIRTDLSWNHDRSLAAVGNENGCIYIVGGEKLNYIHSVFAHKKLVQCLAWHPGTVTSDSAVSPNASWLASASDEVQVINVTPEGVSTVASFHEHAERVVSIMWSPHISGRLVTASYDYTSQVWDVIAGTMLARFDEHHCAVVCCMFSPVDPGRVLTGSCDFTLRSWAVSAYAKNTSGASRNKKQRINLANKKLEGAAEATNLNAQDGHEYVSVGSSGSPEIVKTETKTSLEKAKRAKTMFPVSGSSLTAARHLELLWDRLNIKENSNEDKAGISIVGVEPLSATADVKESSPPPVDETCYLDFFGDDKAMARLLLVEGTHHMAAGNVSNALYASLWSGNISEVLKQATKKKQLNDWLVSLASMVSYNAWVECCVSYSSQLAEMGEGIKASSYLLAIHKIEEAVDVLIQAKQPREAVALAKSRYPKDDPVVHRAVRAWYNQCLQSGQQVLAAHCLLSIGATTEALELLSKTKDAKILSIGARIAAEAGAGELATTLALRSVAASLAKYDFVTAAETLVHYPRLKDARLWVKVCEAVKGFDMIDDKLAKDWLMAVGSLSNGEVMNGNSHLKDTNGEAANAEENATKATEQSSGKQLVNSGVQTKSLFSKCVSVASAEDGLTAEHCKSLSRSLPMNPDHSSHQAAWLYICGQLTLGAMSKVLGAPADETAVHFIKALSAAYAHQVLHPANNVVFLQLVPWLSPKGPWSKLDFLEGASESLVKSALGFVGAAVVFWLERLAPTDKGEEYLNEVLRKAAIAALSPRAVTHFRDRVAAKKLENSLASAPAPVASEDQSKEVPNDREVEQAELEVLRSRQREFEAEHIAAPNPFVVFSSINAILDMLDEEADSTKLARKFLGEHWHTICPDEGQETSVSP